MRRTNVGFGAACEYTQDFTPKKQCANSSSPRILVWGDSVAMHLVPGIISVTNVGVIQATRSTCGPFLGLAPIDPPTFPRAWAERCLSFNQSVMRYLAKNPQIELVVMSSRFDQYLEAEHIPSMLRNDHGRLVQAKPSVALAYGEMRETIEHVRSLGKRVIVFAPPPHLDFDIGGCLERRENRKLVLGPDRNCEVSRARYERQEARLLELLRRLEDEAGVDVVRFDDSLCTGQFCTTELDGIFLYRDSWHLTYDGARLLAREMKWRETLGVTEK
jgi:hypothetical protein